MPSRELLDEAFIRLAALADDEIPLAEGALRIAADEYPDLSISSYLARLDELAIAVRPRLRPDAPLDTLQMLAGFLYEEIGLRGNQADYYDPRNSYLNDVLDRRLGIPITLSVIMIEVGRQLGLPLAGVGLPGQFVVTWRETDVFADPYNGQLLDRNGCYDMVRALHGRPVRVSPDWLAPVSPRHILIRMLYNLKGIWVRREDLKRAIQVIQRLLLLNPDAAGEMRDLGVLYARDDQRAQALLWLQRYVSREPDAADAEQTRRLMTRLVDELAQRN